jgi:hypothetical protein
MRVTRCSNRGECPKAASIGGRPGEQISRLGYGRYLEQPPPAWGGGRTRWLPARKPSPSTASWQPGALCQPPPARAIVVSCCPARARRRAQRDRHPPESLKSDNGPLSRTPAIAFRAVRLRSVIPKERTGVGWRLRHRGCPVLLARCHISSIGLASVSRQVCGRHSLTPSGLPARAGGPGRRGCRIRSRPSAAIGPARRRGQQGRGRRRRCREPTRARQVQDRCPGAGDDLPFCGQHKTNTTPGSGKDQHGNNTDKTVLPGTRRHAC